MIKAGSELRETQALFARVRALAAKASATTPGQQVEVTVGFTAEYALWVHENMEIWPPGMRLRGLPRGGGLYRDKDGVVRVSERILKTGTIGGKHRGFYWDPQGKAQPKFLEGPARELPPEFARMMVASMRAGQTLAQALLQCGLRLQREAQQRVPVDTGTLKASAFTRLGVDHVADEAGMAAADLAEQGGGG